MLPIKQWLSFLKKLTNSIFFLLAVMSASQLVSADALATEYVTAHQQYGPIVGCCYVYQEELAPALSISSAQVCQRSGLFGCVTTPTGPQTWYSTGWWILPTVTTYSMKSSTGSITQGSEKGGLSVFYNCPTSWNSTLISENPPVYSCSRDVPRVDCSECRKKSNEPSSKVGNPIDVLTQTKVQTDTDYVNATGSLSYVRTYQSNTGRWTDNWSSYLVDWNSSTPYQPLNACYFDPWDVTRYCYRYTTVQKPYNFELNRGSAPAIKFDSGADLKPTVDIDDRISNFSASDGSAKGWAIKNAANGTTERYRQDGRLDSIISHYGQVTRLYYSDAITSTDIAPITGLLIRIEDQFGHAIMLRYNSQAQIIALIDPDGHKISYDYNEIGMLSAVTYPDGKTRTYLYNETAHILNGSIYRALTGIIDENSDRYATFKYSSMAASATMHGNGLDNYTLGFANGVTTVSDPLGRISGYSIVNFTSPSNTKKIVQISQPSASGSGSVYASWNYDEQYNVKSKTDFDGVMTNYIYDLSRNLETLRVEAVGTAEVRTISTAWHLDFRLPVKIAEPKHLTTFTYDTEGRRLTRTEQATADTNGSKGLTPTLTGQPQTWTWTYNQFGQVLTVNGPRTDVNDTTVYTYDTSGNLASATNPLGRETLYSGYDESGRVGRVVEPNGLVTERSYTPRGWLASSSVIDRGNVETTIYDYDGVGQIKKVTLPDGAWVKYTYDAAHRLTEIVNHIGNTVAYTLDNAGNRIAEKTIDPNGTVTRQIARIYDKLNNLKQVTGAAQ